VFELFRFTTLAKSYADLRLSDIARQILFEKAVVESKRTDDPATKA
jgi:hypothetical protein